MNEIKPMITHCEQCGNVKSVSYPVPENMAANTTVYSDVVGIYTLCLGHPQVKQEIALDQPVSISNDPSHPLEMELMYFQQHYVMINGQSVKQPQQLVSLIVPETRSHTQVRLVNMAPQTALNLLAWLEGAKETLEGLVKDGEQS